MFLLILLLLICICFVFIFVMHHVVSTIDFEFNTITLEKKISYLSKKQSYTLPECVNSKQLKIIQSSFGNDWQSVGVGGLAHISFVIHHNNIVFVASDVFGQVLMFKNETWTSIVPYPDEINQAGIITMAIREEPFTLFVAGQFSQLNNNPACKHIAAWDGTYWTSLNNGVQKIVESLLYVKETNLLYIGGNGGVMTWDGHVFVSLGQGFAFSNVYAMCFYHGQLYAGGLFSFHNDNNIQHYMVHYKDDHTWQVVASAPNYIVYNLDLYQEKLLVSGKFDFCGIVHCRNIALFDGDIFTSFNNQKFYQYSNNRLVIHNDYIYMVGISFEVLQFDQNGQSLQVGSLFNGKVVSLSVHDNVLYAGGEFDFGNSNGIAKYNLFDRDDVTASLEIKNVQEDLKMHGGRTMLCTNEFGWITLAN